MVSVVKAIPKFNHGLIEVARAKEKYTYSWCCSSQKYGY